MNLKVLQNIQMELLLSKIVLLLGTLELIQGNGENPYGEYEYSEETQINKTSSQTQSQQPVSASTISTRQGPQKRWASGPSTHHVPATAQDLINTIPSKLWGKYYAKLRKYTGNNQNKYKFSQRRLDKFFNKAFKRQSEFSEAESQVDNESPSSQETGMGDSEHHTKKNCTKKPFIDEDSLPENEALLVGAEPIDGPKRNEDISPADLIKKSYQPSYICGSNNPDGMFSCRSICDIRDRQRITCLGKFCYCQTSYGPTSPLEYQPSERSPFFFCGKYNLEGFEKCMDQCKNRNKASVQCGGSSCYCHYTVYKPHPLISKPATNSNETGTESINQEGSAEPEEEQRSKTKESQFIHASYCGRTPTRLNMGAGDKSFPNVIDNINMCRYRCKGGKFTCGKHYCHCVGSGLTIIN